MNQLLTRAQLECEMRLSRSLAQRATILARQASEAGDDERAKLFLENSVRNYERFGRAVDAYLSAEIEARVKEYAFLEEIAWNEEFYIAPRTFAAA